MLFTVKSIEWISYTKIVSKKEEGFVIPLVKTNSHVLDFIQFVLSIQATSKTGMHFRGYV